jgi:ribosome maturation factor RimP
LDHNLQSDSSLEGSANESASLDGAVESKSNSITVEDCANVSRALNLLLDVENLIPGEKPYDLEVSSPGLERDLKQLWHFEESVNKPVKVVIKKGYESESFGNLKSFKATLEKVDGEIIYFKDVENSKLKSIQVPFESIHRSNVVFEYGRVKKH